MSKHAEKVADQNVARRFVERGIGAPILANDPIVALVHPEVAVRLTGTDGNAFAILGQVSQALTRAGVQQQDIEAFRAEAMSGTYDNLLATCMRWVTVS